MRNPVGGTATELAAGHPADEVTVHVSTVPGVCPDSTAPERTEVVVWLEKSSRTGSVMDYDATGIEIAASPIGTEKLSPMRTALAVMTPEARNVPPLEADHREMKV